MTYSLPLPRMRRRTTLNISSLQSGLRGFFGGLERLSVCLLLPPTRVCQASTAGCDSLASRQNRWVLIVGE